MRIKENEKLRDSMDTVKTGDGSSLNMKKPPTLNYDINMQDQELNPRPVNLEVEQFNIY